MDEDLSSDVAKELRDIDSKIGEFVERKVTAEDQLKRTDIRAPQDGIVFQSTANTVGGVIAAGRRMSSARRALRQADQAVRRLPLRSSAG